MFKYHHPGESDRIWRDIIGIHRSTMFSKETFPKIPKPWPPWILFCWCLLSQLFVTQPVPAGWCTMRQENCKNVLQLAVRVAWGTRGSVVPSVPWHDSLRFDSLCVHDTMTSDVSWYLFMSLFLMFKVRTCTHLIWPAFNMIQCKLGLQPTAQIHWPTTTVWPPKGTCTSGRRDAYLQSNLQYL